MQIWFQNRRRRDVVAAASGSVKPDIPKNERIMVPDHVLQSILDELLKYEDDPKGKKLKARLARASTASNVRHKPYSIPPNRRHNMADLSIPPNALAPGYTSFEGPRKRPLSGDLYNQGPSSSSSNSSSSHSSLDLSPTPVVLPVAHLDMTGPPNAIAPNSDIISTDIRPIDLHIREPKTETSSITLSDASSPTSSSDQDNTEGCNEIKNTSPCHISVSQQSNEVSVVSSTQEQVAQQIQSQYNQQQMQHNFGATYGMMAYPFIPPIDTKSLNYPDSYPQGVLHMYRHPLMPVAPAPYYTMDHTQWQQQENNSGTTQEIPDLAAL